MWLENSLKENLIPFVNHGAVTLLLIAVTLALMLRRYRNRRKLPPGPVGLPVLGYYLSVRKDPITKMRDLAKKYGNVMGFYMGPKYVVVLNDWEAVKEVYGLSTSLYRPPDLFSFVPFNLGMLGVDGAEWRQTRNLTSRAMKDTGLNKSDWEEIVHEEVLSLVHRITEEGEKLVLVRKILADSLLRNMLVMILRQHLPVGHPLIEKLLRGVDGVIDYIPTFGLTNFSPTLSKVMELLGVEKKNLLVENTKDFANFVSDTVNEKIQNSSSDMEDSFMGRFLNVIQSNKKDKNPYITVKALKGNLFAILTAGGETIRSTVIWSLVAMADHPEAQRKVHQELDSVIGKDGFIRWKDRSRIPYTVASFFESMRWRTVGPFPALRMATEDISVQGYHIPKGTYITANNYVIHNDPRYWKNPDQFIPENFLIEDGKKVNYSRDSFNPFSYGKRQCPGKLIAEMEGLVYFVVLMQHFKVVPKNGLKVEYDTFLGITYQDTNAELCFIPR